MPVRDRYTSIMRVSIQPAPDADQSPQSATSDGSTGGLPDVDTPERLGEFLRDFYQDVAQDDLLGPMFNEIAQVDWADHIPKITGFWSRFLFGIRGYTGNPMAAHFRIHDQSPFTTDHFVRWLELFHDALDAGWQGENVARMKTLALNVARVHSKQLGVTGETE